MHNLDNVHNPLFYTRASKSPPQHFTRNPVKCFFQVYKGHPQLLFLCQKLFLNLTNHKNSVRGTSPWSESKLHVINFYSIPHSSFYHSQKPSSHDQATLSLYMSHTQEH